MTATDWFSEAGFGVFVNLGHGATRGWELSWQMTGGVFGYRPERDPVACEEYFANALTFDPHRFDAEEWADHIAASGATYAVFNAKHHDGLALYDTTQSDYSIVTSTPFGRDMTAEVVRALRSRGLRVGIYFSIIDWYHPDYPRMTDETVTKPYRLDSWVRTSPEQWARYREFMLAQLTELLTRYGPIDVLWLDGEFEHTREEWDFAQLREHVRALQPDCLVNDRCLDHGDFATPEQQLPADRADGPWELCMTMTDSWGWIADDRWKSIPTLIATLAETASGGGNLLLNVGPRGDGTFPPEAVARLRAIGDWIDRNVDAVRGSIRAADDVRAPVPVGRKIDESGERLFVYCTLRPWDTLALADLPVLRVESVRVLGRDEPLSFTAMPSLPEVHASAPDPHGMLEIALPEDFAADIVPVLEVRLRGLPG